MAMNDQQWAAMLTRTIKDTDNGMTDEEREFLTEKRDGIIPQSAGWAEWKQSRKTEEPK